LYAVGDLQIQGSHPVYSLDLLYFPPMADNRRVSALFIAHCVELASVDAAKEPGPKGLHPFSLTFFQMATLLTSPSTPVLDLISLTLTE